MKKYLIYTMLILASCAAFPSLAESKIAEIEDRIEAQRRKIDQDVEKDKLSRLDSANFKSRQEAIKARAKMSKELHHGKLPKEEYKKLDKDLDRIDKEIKKYEKSDD